LQQSKPANPAIHQATTGPGYGKTPIGAIDVCSGVGTGGTITAYPIIKNSKEENHFNCCEPANSPVISQKFGRQELKPARTKSKASVQGHT